MNLYKEFKVGVVARFFTSKNEAEIKLVSALNIKDNIRIKGNTTNFTQVVTSMFLNSNPIVTGQPGQKVLISTKKKVEIDDVVYKIIPDNDGNGPGSKPPGPKPPGPKPPGPKPPGPKPPGPKPPGPKPPGPKPPGPKPPGPKPPRPKPPRPKPIKPSRGCCPAS